MSSGHVAGRHESAFTVQCRVLHALILRELKSRYGNRRLGFMWALIEPLLFISIFVAGFQLIGRESQGGIPTPLFFVAGFSPFFMFRDVFSDVTQGTRGHQSLLMFPQVTRMDLLLSKLILSTLVSISVPVLGRPLFLTSGLFFSASMLPPAAREIVMYNPLMHCTELIRASLFESFESRYIDLNYVMVFALILISAGMMLLMVFERQRK